MTEKALVELIVGTFDIHGAVVVTDDVVEELLAQHGPDAVMRAMLIGVTRCDVSAGDMYTIVSVWLDGVSSPDAKRKYERERKRQQRAGG